MLQVSDLTSEPSTAVDRGVIAWLLEGDPVIAFQTRRDLLDETEPEYAATQARIASEGWGQAYLAARRPDGHWGDSFYFPKWTSTHYTLLDLRNFGLPPDNEQARESVDLIATTEKRPDGGVGPAKESPASDVCVAGMFLNYASYFGEPVESLRSVVDFLITMTMADGGFNCRLNRSGARHSSLHSTVSVLEGFQTYLDTGYRYRADELREIAAGAREFILIHRFFRSDRTGEIIHPSFLKFAVPPRWKYNILRALDHFAAAGAAHDVRMNHALQVVVGRRRKDGRWNAEATHPGEVHRKLETPRRPGRWVTLIALRVLKAFDKDIEQGEDTQAVVE